MRSLTLLAPSRHPIDVTNVKPGKTGLWLGNRTGIDAPPVIGKIPKSRWEDNIAADLNQSSAYDLISRHAVAVMHSGQ